MRVELVLFNLDGALGDFRRWYEGHIAVHSRPFPGIPFVAVLGNRPGLPLKPDDEVVRSILRASGQAQTGNTCNS